LGSLAGGGSKVVVVSVSDDMDRSSFPDLGSALSRLAADTLIDLTNQVRNFRQQFMGKIFKGTTINVKMPFLRLFLLMIKIILLINGC
jgi:hypothetical protein